MTAYAYGYRETVNGTIAKNAHMCSILNKQVQALLSSMSDYEIARAKSAPREIHTVYHMVLTRAQENGVTILRQALVNERALAVQFALALQNAKKD